MATYSNSKGYADWRDWERQLGTSEYLPTTKAPTSAFVSGALDGDYTGEQSYLSGVGLGGSDSSPKKLGFFDRLMGEGNSNERLGALGTANTLMQGAGLAYSLYDNLFGNSSKLAEQNIALNKQKLANNEYEMNRRREFSDGIRDPNGAFATNYNAVRNA